MSSGIEDTNHFNDIKKRIEEMNKTQIECGIFGEDDSHMLMIATVNEFGATIKPKRATMLAIPLMKKYRGMSPRSVPNSFIYGKKGSDVAFVARRIGRGKNKGQIENAFILKKEVRIPERSFMRAGFDVNKDYFEKVVKKGLSNILGLDTKTENSLDYMGLMITDRIKMFLTNLRTPPNSALTIKLKGSSNPLIDSGRLRASITWKVVKK